MKGKIAAIAAVALLAAGQAGAAEVTNSAVKAAAKPAAASKVTTCVAEAKAKGTAVQASCLNTAGLVPAAQGNAAQSFLGMTGFGAAAATFAIAALIVVAVSEESVSP